MILMIFEKNMFFGTTNSFLRKNRGRKNRRVGIGHNKEFMDPKKNDFDLFLYEQKTILIYFCTNG